MLKQHCTIQAGLCLVGCLQLIAFTSLFFQFPYLYGRHGVQPVSFALDRVEKLQAAVTQAGGEMLPIPTLLRFHGALGVTAEAVLAAVVVSGWFLSAAAACGATHPLVFGALWLLYLSFVSLGGSFVEYGDEVLLEVTFAAIWLAMAHHSTKQATKQQQQQQPQDAIGAEPTHLPGLQQQQPLPAERFSVMVLMMFKWVLFKLLLLTSTFSATLVCGREPSLATCFKSLVAHGQPHGATRWLQTLPGPLGAAGAAVMLLELPAAFFALLCFPALQHTTALALLCLQLLRVTLGPASLANLAAAVLCFTLLDDARWVPGLLKLCRALGLTYKGSGGGGGSGSSGQEQEQEQAPVAGNISRSSSMTSMLDIIDVGGGKHQGELGESLLDNYNWVPWAAAAVFCLSAGLLFGYDSSIGLVLRPSSGQLYSYLQVAVPVAMLAWLATSAPVCWLAVQSCWTACKTEVVAARAAAAEATEAANAAAAAVADATPSRGTPQAAAAGATPRGAAAAARTKPPQANGEASLLAGAAAAAAPKPAGRYLHLLGLQPPLPAPAAAAAAAAAAVTLLHGEGHHHANGAEGEVLANDGDAAHAAAADENEAAGEEDGAGGSSPAPKTKKGASSKASAGKGGSKGASSKAAASRGTKAAPPSPPATAGALHQGAGSSFAAMQPAAAEVAAGGSPAKAAPAAAKKAATKAGASAAAEAAQAAQAAAVAAARASQARRAVLWAWAPGVCSVGAAIALLAVFVAGAPQLLTAVNYNQAAIRQFMPGPLLFFGKVLRSCGMASGSSSCRSAFLATQQAAASSSGPGSFVLYEPYVLDEAVGSWRKVPIKYGLGSSQLKTRASWWQKLQGARGWCQMRLQAKMATAAVAGGAGGGAAAAEGAGSQHDVEPWLVVLAEKIVAGSPELVGLLDRPVRAHDYVTINRVAYSPALPDWQLDAANQPPAVQPQRRDSRYLWAYSDNFKSQPGNDGTLTALVEAVARSAPAPVVLAGLLLAVVLRHLLLPGGLLQECQRALAAAAVE